MLDAYSKAWTWFEEKHSDLPRKVGVRTGNLFPLNNDRKLQFSGCVYRGYDDHQNKPMNPFQNETFKHAVARLGNSNRQKRKLKGAALTFSKRRKATEEVLRKLN